MNSQTKLEINGNLSEHPLAELLVETTEANLSGSFRLVQAEQKIIIYLNQGKVVFAVSNLRQHRLFSIVLRENKLTQAELQTFPNLGNDTELSANLVAQNFLTQPDANKLISRQIEAIIKFCLEWKSGEWVFNSLARIKEGINFEVDLHKLMLEFSRSILSDDILKRFESNQESFGIKPEIPFQLNLQSHEAFVLSRFEKEFMTLGELDNISGLPENITRQVLYSLWLGGFLFRQNWDCVLSENKIAGLLSETIRRVSTNQPQSIENKSGLITNEAAESIKQETKATEAKITEEKVEEKVEEIDEEQHLLSYLERVENAFTLYETIGIASESETSKIKQAYFAQARKYHPDLFHKNEEFHHRVQNAFTKLAHAYEILKSEESRDLYNFKMRKELAELKENQKSGISVNEAGLNKIAEQAAENFEIGLNLLQDNEFEAAVPFFARAVYFDGNNARYHAFYGKALSSDKKNLHKAEGELQTAIKIEPQITTYRLMLAELFIHIGLNKRAEGELNRLLTIAPTDKDALALLDSLRKK